MTNILDIQPSIRTLRVKHPATGESIDLEIDFRSMDSPEVKAVERELKNKALRSGRNTSTVEKIEDAEYAIIHACIAAWRWPDGMTLDGVKNPPLTRENTEKLFRTVQWVKKQLDDEMRDETGFFSTVRTSSSKS